MIPNPVSRDPRPAREVWVAQALIKARISGKAEPVYLLQRDEDLCDEYRLIGGRLEPSDRDLHDTMVREMLEELGLVCEKDYALHELIHELQLSARLSPTFGVLTVYHYRVYGVRMQEGVQPRLGVNRWATKQEMLAGYADTGERIAVWHAQAIDDQLPDGLEGVPLSFSETQGDVQLD